MDLALWKIEYICYKHDDLRRDGTKEDMVHLAHETDFTSHDAKVFKEGWDAAHHVIAAQFQTVLNDVMSEE